MRVIAPALVLVAMPRLAAAHTASAETVFDALAFGSLFLAAALYAIAWRRGAITRGREALAFAAGLAVLALAVATPATSARPFALHMIQHELMMLVAPPLVILGRPFAALASVLPRTAVAMLAAPLRLPPLAAFGLHAAALWIWHVPRLFDTAVAAPWVHALQHATFLVTALWFWWAVFRGVRRGAAVFYVLATMLHMGALAALLAWAPAPLYADTALADQQLGGLIMWVPASLLMVAAGLATCARLLEDPR